MMVANRATLSGISEHPFFPLSLPPQRGVHGDIHDNIRLELSPAPLGFGWMAAAFFPECVSRADIAAPQKRTAAINDGEETARVVNYPVAGRIRALPGALSEKAELRLLCEQHRWRSRAALCNRALANHDLLLELLRLC